MMIMAPRMALVIRSDKERADPMMRKMRLELRFLRMVRGFLSAIVVSGL